MNAITAANYDFIRHWLRHVCGVEIGERRQNMVQSRLSRRVSALALDNINAYVDHLKPLNISNILSGIMWWIYSPHTKRIFFAKTNTLIFLGKRFCLNIVVSR